MVTVPALRDQVTLEDLPRVLAVQVKRFVYLDGQPKKLHRKVSFRQKLGLPRKGNAMRVSSLVQDHLWSTADSSSCCCRWGQAANVLTVCSSLAPRPIAGRWALYLRRPAYP